MSVGQSIGHTYFIFPDFGLIKLSLGKIKSKYVNSSNFGCGYGIDEATDQMRSLIDPLC